MLGYVSDAMKGWILPYPDAAGGRCCRGYLGTPLPPSSGKNFAEQVQKMWRTGNAFMVTPATGPAIGDQNAFGVSLGSDLATARRLENGQ